MSIMGLCNQSCLAVVRPSLRLCLVTTLALDVTRNNQYLSYFGHFILFSVTLTLAGSHRVGGQLNLLASLSATPGKGKGGGGGDLLW